MQEVGFLTSRKKTKMDYVKKYSLIFLGAIITAIGLEIFLIPNNIIDGGIVGISIMASYLTKQPIGLFLVLFNLPFLYLGYKQIGKTFTISTLFAIISLAYWTTQFGPILKITEDLFLAAVFGGLCLGVGVGLIIRYGGSLDGTEIVAIIIDKRCGFSVGEIVMFMNLFILSSAGFIFGLDKAMYSIVTYFIAAKVIDVVIQGVDESKGVMIVTDEWQEISDAIMARLGRGVTILHGEGGYSGDPKKVLYCVITRLEVEKLKGIVSEKDDNAFVTINEVHDVIGGRFKKKAIH